MDLANYNEMTLPIGTIVNDADSGESIEISRAMLEEAYQAQGVIISGFMLAATALAKMKNRKLYLALGFYSFRDYCNAALPFTARNAYRYAFIGERVQGVLGDDLPAEEVGAIGVKKLKILAENSEEEFKKLLENGTYRVDDNELDAVDIQKESYKKLAEKLKKAENKAAKAEQYEAERDKLALEKESLFEQVENLQNWVQENRDRVETDKENKLIIEQVWKQIANSSAQLGKLNFEKMSDNTKGDLALLFAKIDEHLNLIKKVNKGVSAVLAEIHLSDELDPKMVLSEVEKGLAI